MGGRIFSSSRRLSFESAVRTSDLADPIRAFSLDCLLIRIATADHVVIARSTDGGKSFGRPVPVNSEPARIDPGPDSRPGIAIGKNGEILVSYTVFTGDAYIGRVYIGRSTDGSLLTFISQHEQLDRPYTWDKNLEDKIKSITLDQVNAAFKKHVDPSGVSIMKVGDFKAAKVFQ